MKQIQIAKAEGAQASAELQPEDAFFDPVKWSDFFEYERRIRQRLQEVRG